MTGHLDCAWWANNLSEVRGKQMILVLKMMAIFLRDEGRYGAGAQDVDGAQVLRLSGAMPENRVPRFSGFSFTCLPGGVVRFRPDH